MDNTNKQYMKSLWRDWRLYAGIAAVSAALNIGQEIYTMQLSSKIDDLESKCRIEHILGQDEILKQLPNFDPTAAYLDAGNYKEWMLKDLKENYVHKALIK